MMKVIGTQKANVEVEISPFEIIAKLKQQFLGKMPGEYINKAGNWEWWDDCRGQGSGITYEERKATDEEVEKLKAFNVILNHTKGME